ncbi:MAG: threonine ammonia-lyase [Chloroflexi bacterium]|nr:threonine ammonia-lyase [Chloroflexota bacterium]
MTINGSGNESAASGSLPLVDLSRVQSAAARIQSYIRRTPAELSEPLGELTGRHLTLKLENLQHTGAFKIRGALSRLLAMSEQERQCGVITASAGNHGLGVALAARLLGISATVVVPTTVPLAKLTAIQRQGAEAVLDGATYDDAHAAAVALAAERTLTYVHAFDDPDVIAGQGTLALELLEDAPDLDAILAPVGGGGLISGVAVVAKAIRPNLRVIGVQASGSPAMAESFREGRLMTAPSSTIADGIAVKRPGDLPFELINRLVDDVITVDDEAIARAIVLLLERHKLLAEGAGATALAAVLLGEIPARLRRVGVIISGGNVDPNLLGKVLQQGLASAGRYLAIRTWLDDQPGRLHQLTGLLTADRINIIHISIHRLGPYTGIGKVGLDLIVETRDRAHALAVLDLIRQHGFPAEETIASHPPTHNPGAVPL